VPAAFDRAAVDITAGDAVAAALAARRPDLAINLAAYTAVDRAENEAAAAHAVNCAGAVNLALHCAEHGIPLIHLSTDYVFDGSKEGGYREDDPVDPLGVYGASKAAGERAVREALSRHIILRTSWVFGAFGQNFVKTMLRLGTERPLLRVVADQRGCPTAAADIAAALIALAQHIDAGAARWGTYHFAGAGVTTWHGFADAIFDLAEPYWRRRPQVEAIATDEYPTAARRPRNSVLDCGKIGAAFGIRPPPWRPALAAVVRELLEAPA
jgi:dTDP-4-dehydrorhamnose reductase